MRPLTATLVLLLLATSAQAQTADPQLEDPGFDAALPPLDATQPPSAPNAVAEPAPEPLAPTPAPDPQAEVELAAPLPPLATFDVTPPVALAGVDDDEKASEVRYRLTIEGLKEVGLADEFGSFSALVKGAKKGANVAQVQGRADEDVQLAERLLRSQGYYDGTASAVVTPVATAPGQLDVALTATPGPRYALGKITVTGPDTVPPRLPYDLLGLKTGDPIVATAIETAEANVALRLPERGYPFVEVGQRDIVLDGPGSGLKSGGDRRGDYTLPVTPGPRSSFGAFRTAGDPVFDAKHLSLFPRYKTGALYDSRGVDDVRQALVATGLFSTVAIEPVRTGQPGPDETETVDLLVRQTKGLWRSLNGSVGYGTGEGIKLQGNFTHRNLFPPEGALSLTAVAGTQEQRVAAAFRRSNAGQRDRAFQAGIDISRENRAAFRAYTANINASLSRVSTPIWQKRWTYSIGAELIATRENRYNFAILARDDTNFFIGALPLQLGYDRSDSLLDPTKGFRITARVSPEASLQGSFSGYARTLVEGSTYFGVSDNLVFAGRARAGSIQGLARDRIAPSRRLYAGGGGSVRGYGYQALGPRDPNGDPVGGRSLTEFSLEARYRFGGVYGVVPFIDAGQSYTSSTPGLSDLRYGVGIGGRYYTNFGPLRVDIATPLGRRAGDPKVAVYFSIGQAF